VAKMIIPVIAASKITPPTHFFRASSMIGIYVIITGFMKSSLSASAKG
jgi:hypothetical protein